MSIRRLPPFAALRSFEGAARQLSFKRAAEDLCVTPSAISHQVKILEAWVGTPLFERDVRRIALTRKGQELYLSTSKCLDELALAFTSAKDPRARSGTRRLRVCGDSGFVEFWLASRLDGFLAQASVAPIEVHWGNSAEDYRKCRADIVLHYGRPDGLPYESIAQWRYHEFPVCSPSLITKGVSLTTLSDLRRVRLLHERGTESWMHWLSWAGMKDVGWADAGPVYHGASTCLGAAAAGQGAALTDEMAGADLLMSGGLVKPLGKTRESDDYTLNLMCRRDLLSDAGASAFVNWLYPAINTHRQLMRMLTRQSPFHARARSAAALERGNMIPS